MESLKKNVLIFPGGTENGLEIKRSLQYCKEVKIFSASSAVPNQAMFAYIDNSIIPDVHDNTCLFMLNELIKEKQIDIIIPANSVVIDFLNTHRDEIACDILLPAKEIVELTRSKKRTISMLKDVINVPRCFDKKEEIFEDQFPVFAKPDGGYGAKDARLITNKYELEAIDFSSFVVEEYLPGREYTIDCFSDDTQVLFSAGRERVRIRMGTTMHCEELEDSLQQTFESIAKTIHARIPITGFWFFQMKEDRQGHLKLLEIDIRIAGTMAYHRCKGVNFPLLALFQYYGYPVRVSINHGVSLTLDRCLQNSFSTNLDYNYVYIDLDNTLHFNGRVNLQMIRFLFQCINNRVKLILLSKNDNKDSFLKELRVYQLFDQILWLKESESKADYIHHTNSIFIDDSFSQRQEVAEKCGIPTFDPSMVECLLEDRA